MIRYVSEGWGHRFESCRARHPSGSHGNPNGLFTPRDAAHRKVCYPARAFIFRQREGGRIQPGGDSAVAAILSAALEAHPQR